MFANTRWLTLALCFGLTLTLIPGVGSAQKKKKKKAEPVITYPPKLPGGKKVVTVKTDAFLKPTETLRKGIAIAKTPPTVDFAYIPGQDYEGKPWSNWGDSLAVKDKYYLSLGDHLAVDRKTDGKSSGTGFVYEYDPQKKTFRQLIDVAKVLNLPKGHYTPGKIHGRLDMGKDGWLYFSTHRGSTRVTTDENHYKGDWILRVDPKSGKSEVLAQGPAGKHCIPTSILDPDRLIFYGGTAPATKEGVERFLAYDVAKKKVIQLNDNGPARYMILARSTGKVYYVAGRGEEGGMVGPLMRFDPAKGGAPEKIDAKIGLRAATLETPGGIVYTVSQGGKNGETMLYAFNTKTEKVTELGAAAVGSAGYITTLDADPTGRYVYYIPGAHGGSEKDGSAIVQFDTKTRKKKVIAFLHPYFADKYGAILKGTFSSALSPEGDKLYVTWNVSRGSRAWDCCALTVIHIPESERQP